MAKRPELEPYIGKTVTIEASIISRADGGQYGFLLTNISVPNGAYVDHCWLGVYHNDLATVSGHRIRCDASIHTYWKASRIDGRYVECAEEGTGIADINEVSVFVSGDWLSLDEAARRIRKSRAANVKAKKASGEYVWPGTWTYTTGNLKVKAAKSAVPGSLCDVRSRDGLRDKLVKLVTQVAPGVWGYEEVTAHLMAQAT